MNCDDLLRELCDHIDGEGDRTLCEELRKRMGGCDSCRVVVDNVRNTIRLYRGQTECELPEGFEDKLHRALRRKWEQTHGPQKN